MDNAQLHEQEKEVLSSIYLKEWKCVAEGSETYSMQVKPDVTLFVTFTADYPSKSAPHYELFAPCLPANKKRQISKEFKRIFLQNFGETILYQWIETLKEIVESSGSTSKSVTNSKHAAKKEIISTKKVTRLDAIHGPTIEDRKSVFQGHAASINSEKLVKEFIDLLCENKKVSQATHNICAYRLRLPNGVIAQDCDDDGENHAGGRLLRLLQIADAMNCVVVVSRWYGGIHLGPDRFKHINNAARQALLAGGFLKN